MSINLGITDPEFTFTFTFDGFSNSPRNWGRTSSSFGSGLMPPNVDFTNTGAPNHNPAQDSGASAPPGYYRPIYPGLSNPNNNQNHEEGGGPDENDGFGNPDSKPDDDNPNYNYDSGGEENNGPDDDENDVGEIPALGDPEEGEPDEKTDDESSG